MKKTFLFITIVLLSLTLFSVCKIDDSCASQFSDDIIRRLDDTINAKMQEMNLPGVVVAIWIPGEGEYFSAKGVANLEMVASRELDDPFRIASITKTFTATAVLQLVDEGKLNTSDKLWKFFPEFPNADIISIRNLLRMRSGIADFADSEFLKNVYQDPYAWFSAEDLINISANRVDRFEDPGYKTRYCNVNYVILGEIVKKITGNEIGDQITKSILEPLGMNNTIYPVNSDLSGNLHGYSWNPETNNFDDMTVLNPLWAGAAGATISNISDLKIFVRALCSNHLLSESTQEACFETRQFEDMPDWIRYGEGISNLGSFWGHNGTIFGFSSEMWYLPAKDSVILINVNRLDLDDQSKSTPLFFAIAKILFPKYVKW